MRAIPKKGIRYRRLVAAQMKRLLPTVDGLRPNPGRRENPIDLEDEDLDEIRLFGCPLELRCLDIAEMSCWSCWSCERCDVFKNVLEIRRVNNAKSKEEI